MSTHDLASALARLDLAVVGNRKTGEFLAVAINEQRAALDRMRLAAADLRAYSYRKQLSEEDA